MMSDIPHVIVREIETVIGSKVNAFSMAGGGCINRCGNCSTDAGTIFLKWNDNKKFPGMFAAEARGLSLLQKATPLHVPEVLHSGQADSFQFLFLENIREGRRSDKYWETFGRGLAMLHRNTSDQFGLDHDNYIGSLRQANNPTISWLEFFGEQRLRTQLKMAVDRLHIDIALINKFEVLVEKLEGLIPKEAPSLLHGDLWGGNIMIDDQGEPVLIDPAVYFGHREMDLAMTQLFGGFNPGFLDIYKEVFPLSPGFEGRCDIFNLYPLLVHVNLFGRAYVQQVLSIINRYA